MIDLLASTPANDECVASACLQNFAQVAQDDGSSRWVLGWQFAAGEHLQQSKDVFGDAGIQKVVWCRLRLRDVIASQGGCDANQLL
jgi:hypothetical protein